LTSLNGTFWPSLEVVESHHGAVRARFCARWAASSAPRRPWYEARARFTRRQRGAGGVIRGRRPRVPLARLPGSIRKIVRQCRADLSAAAFEIWWPQRCSATDADADLVVAGPSATPASLTGSAHHCEAVCRRSNRLRPLALG